MSWREASRERSQADLRILAQVADKKRQPTPHRRADVSEIPEEMEATVLERFLEMLDYSAGVQGVHIDFDECAALAADIRQALARTALGQP